MLVNISHSETKKQKNTLERKFWITTEQ